MRNRDKNDIKGWLETARKLYQELHDTLKRELASNNNDAKYLCEMENALLLFSEGRLKQALKIYLTQAERIEWKDRHIISYRLGEIYLRLGKSVPALTYYDKCEGLLDGKEETENIRDMYRVKSHLAKVYWSLGPEFIATAIRKIEEAEKILNIYEERLGEHMEELRGRLSNNICWYYLEKYIISINTENEGKYFMKAEEKFKELTEFIANNPDVVSANDLDTAAWFCFQASKRLSRPGGGTQAESEDYGKRALSFSQKMWGKSNKSTFDLQSRCLQISHIKDIVQLIEPEEVEEKTFCDA